MLNELAPGSASERVRPADADTSMPAAVGIAQYDAIFLTGSPLHVYDDTPEVRRQIAFMREVFASGTPAFGSCAGFQVAVAAAGGTIRPAGERREAGFARRIVATAAGRDHPLLRGRPPVFDAPSFHSDEIATLPAGATLLAANGLARAQAVDIRFDGRVFRGVQYHPELSRHEVAAALRREAAGLVEGGMAARHDDVEVIAAMVDALDRAPTRPDLAWRLGLDAEVTDAGRRRTELRNFVDHLVRPTMARRGRA